MATVNTAPMSRETAAELSMPDEVLQQGQVAPALPAAEYRVPSTEELIRKYAIDFDALDREMLDAYEKSVRSFWTVDEVAFTHDREGWEKLPPAVQRLFRYVLAFFLVGDGMILDSFSDAYKSRLPDEPEIKMLMDSQAAIEWEHARTYSRALNVLLTEKQLRFDAFNALHTSKALEAKIRWACEHTSAKYSLGHVVLARAMSEGIMFQGSFGSIFWLRDVYPTSCPGFIFSNKVISRDEAHHWMSGVTTYQFLLRRGHLKEPLPEAEIRGLLRECVSLSVAFMQEALPEDLPGLKLAQITQFIQCIADAFMERLKMEPEYRAVMPFDFMELASVDQKNE